MSVNKAIILGNVTAQPEIRSTNDGREIANFSIATNEKWKDKNDTPKEKVEYHKIVVFNQGLVGIVKNYVKKGAKLYIEGQLQTRKWTDKNGIDKYITEIILQNLRKSRYVFNSTLQIISNNKITEEKAIEEEETVVKIDDEIPF